MSSSPPFHIGEQQAKAELESYIFGGHYGRPSVPRDIEPRLVEQFIRTRVDRRAAPSAFHRSRWAADWYDLQSLAEHFERLLDHGEQSERSYDQSLGAVTLVGVVGTQEQAGRASAYLAYLVDHKLALQRFDLLVETYAALAPHADPEPLAKRMSAQMQAFKKESDDYERVDQELNNNLPRVRDEARLERATLGLPPLQRIQRLARIYAGWDEAESIELTWWSARWLRRMAHAGDPEVVRALRSVLTEVDASKLPADESAPYRTRILRAIRFLGGVLSDTERRFLARSAARQWDVLDHEEVEEPRHG